MKYNILHGDCRELMATLDENSVDAIVTDPPYELGFMGKSWDASGVAFDVNTWKEALRVLKPGGHLIAFSGSRTYHRMAVAIEDAGFEIRDQIMWVYGSGFPKSHNISKGIDKAAGAVREVVGETRKGAQSESTGGYGAWGDGITPTAPATPAAQQWDGWGTALKPAHEPMVLARKPVIGTVANNVLIHGTGGLNIDGSRVGTEGGTKASETFADSESITAYGNGLNGNKKPLALNAGRWPANFIHDGSDEVVALFPNSKSTGGTGEASKNFKSDGRTIGASCAATGGFGDSGSAARFFYCAKASKKDRNEGLDGLPVQRRAGLMGSDNDNDNLDPVSERFRTLPSANHHPTVKPTTLMQYLVRLVTPPNGTVLDPFLGSGSTGKACAYEGFDFIGMELTAEYIPIATARIEFALATKGEMLDL
jgi:site-specific DNA-methyltransferase (adenine-specific)